jgi:hypothetical protein
MILFFNITFLILRGDKRLGHLLPDAFTFAAAALSAAIATPAWKPVSFLQVSAHPEANPVAIKNCRLPINF